MRYGGTDAAMYLRVQHFGRFAATQAVLHECLGIHLDKIVHELAVLQAGSCSCSAPCGAVLC